ncbi:MAG: twin-arginine translocation pathway signal protein [Rhodovulum sp.]|jgi:hypothetical protein|nr:twin-arginine translocation pathway signal protein [Rhodovulum sp.]
MITRRNFMAAGAAMVAGAAAGPVFAGGHGRLGTFSGRSGHVTGGTVEIVGDMVHLLDDFILDGAPDPKVALGYNGVKTEWILAPLAKNKGKSSYKVPANIDLDHVNEVWIWCEEFSVPLGYAKI